MCYDFQPKEKAGKTGVCILFEHLEKEKHATFSFVSNRKRGKMCIRDRSDTVCEADDIVTASDVFHNFLCKCFVSSHFKVLHFFILMKYTKRRSSQLNVTILLKCCLAVACNDLYQTQLF